MPRPSRLPKWQQRAIQSVVITVVVLAGVLLSLIITGAEGKIRAHPWYIAGLFVAIYLMAYATSLYLDLFIFVNILRPSEERNSGLVGGVSDRITDSVLSFLHSKDRKRSG